MKSINAQIDAAKQAAFEHFKQADWRLRFGKEGLGADLWIGKISFRGPHKTYRATVTLGGSVTISGPRPFELTGTDFGYAEDAKETILDMVLCDYGFRFLKE